MLFGSPIQLLCFVWDDVRSCGAWMQSECLTKLHRDVGVSVWTGPDSHFAMRTDPRRLLCACVTIVACRVVLFCRSAVMHRPVMVLCVQESSFSMLSMDLNGNNKVVFSVSQDENGEITKCGQFRRCTVVVVLLFWSVLIVVLFV